MISLRARKIVFIGALLLSFVGLLPGSALITDPLFTHPFDPRWQYGVLLVWPDHIELRWVHSIAEVSPRSKDASYTFNVEPERQKWVEEQVRHAPSRNTGAAWSIRVKQLGPDRQQIQLELWKDGFTGLVYEARPDQIVPLRTRHAGPGSALIILYVHLLVWGTIWLAVWLVWR
ncbi:MAG TPA: hypothetical protein VI488_08330 [Candidatus Angelobacter sp.]